MIELKEDDPSAVKAMVEYFYFDNYSHMQYQPPGYEAWNPVDLDMIPLHAHIYVLADKYDISGLRNVAKANLDDTLCRNTNWITTTHFLEAIRIVYEQTTETASIRKSVVNIIVNNRESVFDDELRTLILSFPPLADEVITAFGSIPVANVAAYTAQCQYCGKTLTDAETLELVIGGVKGFSPANNKHCFAPGSGWRNRSGHIWTLKQVPIAQSPGSDCDSWGALTPAWGQIPDWMVG